MEKKNNRIVLTAFTIPVIIASAIGVLIIVKLLMPKLTALYGWFIAGSGVVLLSFLVFGIIYATAYNVLLTVENFSQKNKS